MPEEESIASPESTSSSAKPPFHSFSFTMTDKGIGRRVFRMKYQLESNDYQLHIEAGPSADPEQEFDRVVSRTHAEKLLGVLSDIDAFNWESGYGDTAAPGTLRWNTNIVFQENVFSLQSFGGSDVPAGFDDLLEALYQMDLPRPAQSASTPFGQGPSGMAGTPDFSSLFGGLGGPGGPDPEMFQQMQEAFADMQRNPEAFAQQMRDEFRHLPYEQQESLIDVLASSGMATREWWERFFRS